MMKMIIIIKIGIYIAPFPFITCPNKIWSIEKQQAAL